MNSPIKVGKNTIKFAKEYLGVDEIFVWVGHGFDPQDNEDQRVKETRELMAKYFNHIPYGANVGNRQSDNTMKPVTDEDGDGYYDLDVSWWPEGVYRLNYHSVVGQESPHGSPLSGERDQDVSWPKWLDAIDEESKPFLHEEKNGAGYCFRILIRPDRTIEAF